MNHQLIERLQNFTLDRKILSIDTNDRDIKKWPNPAEFEVSCPQVYSNIESIRLLNIQCPNIFYNISERLQNNKLVIQFNSGPEETITLDDGLYTPLQLQTSLQNDLSNNVDPGFKVIYNEVNKKMYFGHTSSDFSLLFEENITYNNCNNNQSYNTYNDIFKQHSNWGLGALLGFDKKTYESTTSSNDNNYKFPWNPANTPWIANGSNIIIADKNLDLDVNQTIFIEIDRLNSCDEIMPYIVNNYTNTNSGIINSFFAKVPIIQSKSKYIFSTKDCCADCISYYQPPIEKLSKLKIKIRYHNGMLIDLQNYNISMIFEINQIRNEIKDYTVRTPFKI